MKKNKKMSIGLKQNVLKFNKKAITSVLVAAVMSTNFTAFAYASSIPTSRTVTIRGVDSLIGEDVAKDSFTITRKDSTFPGRSGLKVTAGDIIETGTGVTAYFEIDGSIVVEMFQNTKVEIAKTKSNELEINILSGEVFFDTSGKLKDDENFGFSAGGMVMAVRGTSGTIGVTSEGTADATLYTGLVEIIDINDDGENPEVMMSLTPGNRIEHDGDFFVSEPVPNSIEDMSNYEILVLTKLLDEYTEFSNFTASTIETTSAIRDVINSIFENSDLPVVEFSTIDPNTPNTIIPPTPVTLNVETTSDTSTTADSATNYFDSSQDSVSVATSVSALDEIIAMLSIKTEEIVQEVVEQKVEEERIYEERQAEILQEVTILPVIDDTDVAVNTTTTVTPDVTVPEVTEPETPNVTEPEIELPEGAVAFSDWDDVIKSQFDEDEYGNLMAKEDAPSLVYYTGSEISYTSYVADEYIKIPAGLTVVLTNITKIEVASQFTVFGNLEIQSSGNVSIIGAFSVYNNGVLTVGQNAHITTNLDQNYDIITSDGGSIVGVGTINGTIAAIYGLTPGTDGLLDITPDVDDSNKEVTSDSTTDDTPTSATDPDTDDSGNTVNPDNSNTDTQVDIVEDDDQDQE